MVTLMKYLHVNDSLCEVYYGPGQVSLSIFLPAEEKFSSRVGTGGIDLVSLTFIRHSCSFRIKNKNKNRLHADYENTHPNLYVCLNMYPNFPKAFQLTNLYQDLIKYRSTLRKGCKKERQRQFYVQVTV